MAKRKSVICETCGKKTTKYMLNVNGKDKDSMLMTQKIYDVLWEALAKKQLIFGGQAEYLNDGIEYPGAAPICDDCLKKEGIEIND